jgi:hypothetical protein
MHVWYMHNNIRLQAKTDGYTTHTHRSNATPSHAQIHRHTRTYKIWVLG